MSYGRDPDRLHHGVGAIAARDAGNRQAAVRRRARARALMDRDRALSRYTYGPFGGIGAVDITTDGATKKRPDQPGTGANPWRDTGGGSSGGGSVVLPGRMATVSSAVPGRMITTTGGSGLLVGRYTQLPGMIIDPVRGTITPTTGASGGGGGVVSGGMALPPAPVTELPPSDPLTDPPVSGGMDKKKVLLIGAAVAGGLYLLLRKKKGATTP